MPFLDVVEFASVHWRTAVEAAAVPDSHRQALRGVPESLLATQPQDAAGPVEDHAG